MCRLKESGSNKTAMFSHQLLSNIFSSNWKGTPFATGSKGIFFFFGSEVHLWNASLFNFYKVTGPQTLTNELHYTQGSTYLLWQSVSLEEWYLHMGGWGGPESRFLSCLLVSVTLVHKSSHYFRSGRKLGTFKTRKQKPRAEITQPLTCPQGRPGLPSLLVVLRRHNIAEALKSGRKPGQMLARSTTGC